MPPEAAFFEQNVFLNAKNALLGCKNADKTPKFPSACGEQKFEFFIVISHEANSWIPPGGVGGGVPGFSGVRLYSQNLNGLSPMADSVIRGLCRLP